MEIQVLQVEKLYQMDEMGEDNTLLVFELSDGVKFGVSMPHATADELTGALIERDVSGFRQLGSSPSEDVCQDVSDHSFEQVEPDAYVLELTGEKGTVLSFRLGTRRVRRIRDQMTAHIVRQERKSGTQ